MCLFSDFGISPFSYWRSFYAAPVFTLREKMALCVKIRLAIGSLLDSRIKGLGGITFFSDVIDVDIPLFNSIFVGNVDVSRNMKPVLAFEEHFDPAFFPRDPEHPWDQAFRG